PQTIWIASNPWRARNAAARSNTASDIRDVSPNHHVSARNGASRSRTRTAGAPLRAPRRRRPRRNVPLDLAPRDRGARLRDVDVVDGHDVARADAPAHDGAGEQPDRD